MDATCPKWWDRLCTLEGEEPLAFDDKMAFGGVRSLSLQTDAVKDDVLVIWRHPKLGTALHILPEGTEMELSMRVLAEQKTRCASTSHPRKRSISSWRSQMGASSVAWCMT